MVTRKSCTTYVKGLFPSQSGSTTYGKGLSPSQSGSTTYGNGLFPSQSGSNHILVKGVRLMNARAAWALYL